jgi:hypothetical protein
LTAVVKVLHAMLVLCNGNCGKESRRDFEELHPAKFDVTNWQRQRPRMMEV